MGGNSAKRARKLQDAKKEKIRKRAAVKKK